MRKAIFLGLLSLAAAARAVDPDREYEQHGDVEVAVALDAGNQSGHAAASVRIHAPREVVWELISSCAAALEIVPGLVGCSVEHTAPDHSWQLIHHVMNYSWFLKKLNYDLRATYVPPERASFERVAGDLKELRVSWVLTTEGADTVAHYQVDIAPGFWVPLWLERLALKRDLPKMLRTLRSRAEAARG